MLGIVEPAQLGDAADELNQAGCDKIRQLRALACEVGEDVISDVHALSNGEIVPILGDELGEGVGGHEQGVGRVGVVENVLALGDVFRGGLQGEELLLGLLALRLVAAVVEGVAQPFQLLQGLGVHARGVLVLLLVLLLLVLGARQEARA